ncbi:MAG: methyltransferase family protein [Gemmatimonadales bacterium]
MLADRLARWAAVTVLYGAILFALSGRWGDALYWAYLAATSVAALVLVLTIDPELARERRRPGPGGIDRWRRVPMTVFLFAHLVVGTLDAGRYHWSDSVGPALRGAGLLGSTAAMAWLVWAVAVNRFFSPVVRIQTERAHQLVTRGPYRVVRHPGYLGMLLVPPCSALALGSWWALVPALVCTLLVLRRAVIEDRYLVRHLDGYQAYANTVRWRLLPGVW